MKRSTPAKRLMFGTCTSDAVGTFSLQETASVNNTNLNWKVAAEVVNDLKKKSSQAKTKFHHFFPGNQQLSLPLALYIICRFSLKNNKPTAQNIQELNDFSCLVCFSSKSSR